MSNLVRDQAKRQRELSEVSASPGRNQLRQALATMSYDEQLAAVRPPLPVASAVQRQVDGFVCGGDEATSGQSFEPQPNETQDYEPSHPEWTLATYTRNLELKFFDVLRAGQRGITTLRNELDDQRERSLVVDLALQLGSAALTAAAGSLANFIARLALAGSGRVAQSVLSSAIRSALREAFQPGLDSLRPNGTISAAEFLDQQWDTLDLASVRAREAFVGDPTHHPTTIEEADRLYLAMDAAYLTAPTEQHDQSLSSWMAYLAGLDGFDPWDTGQSQHRMGVLELVVETDTLSLMYARPVEAVVDSVSSDALAAIARRPLGSLAGLPLRVCISRVHNSESIYDSRTTEGIIIYRASTGVVTIGPSAASQYLERVHLGPLHAPNPDAEPDYDLSLHGARDFLRWVIDPLVLETHGIPVEEA